MRTLIRSHFLSMLLRCLYLLIYHITLPLVLRVASPLFSDPWRRYFIANVILNSTLAVEELLLSEILAIIKSLIILGLSLQLVTLLHHIVPSESISRFAPSHMLILHAILAGNKSAIDILLHGQLGHVPLLKLSFLHVELTLRMINCPLIVLLLRLHHGLILEGSAPTQRFILYYIINSGSMVLKYFFAMVDHAVLVVAWVVILL